MSMFIKQEGKNSRSYTHNVSSEVNVGEFLVDVLDGGLHGFICQEGEPQLRVCTGLQQRLEKDRDVRM